MNVTIKLDNSRCKEARLRAVDEGLSLSGWIQKLLDRELAGNPHEIRGNLLDIFGDRRAANVKLELRPSSRKPSTSVPRRPHRRNRPCA